MPVLTARTITTHVAALRRKSLAATKSVDTRRNGVARKLRQPVTRETGPGRPPAGWSGDLTRRSSTDETRYEAALAAKGRIRPMPNSRPPSGGPASCAV
jgi:hypothetical protein